MNNKTTIIGEELRKIRKDRGYQVQELADLINVSKGYLGNIESGNRTPSLKLLKKLSMALNFDIKEFLDTVTLRAVQETKEIGQTMGFYNNIDDEMKIFKEENEELVTKSLLSAVELMALENNVLLNEKDLNDIINLVDVTIRLRLEQCRK
ncbi:helix-turn-helix domain-containing protein [Clostridium perfringens]|uniref:helix-turn-helix domain-containing protein n=3 Tax=Clostridium perfringens TaxID=1502 RepID=UPI002988743C|nr:helix-turn-helix transcriptional regulator [Clostridium perfringens]MDM0981886.1 helix-turn-helix transcriptional regulator [Clostridium perfringens]MDZ4972824.1 helix-turn-helix domain-containing protein [Clostridium perfringens]